jgi:O-methyltransferase
VIARLGWGLAARPAAHDSDQRSKRTCPPDFDDQDVALYDFVDSYTMTPPERVFALRRAVEYVVAAGVAGSIVECGVWRGGSMMAAARTLGALGVDDRDLFLFDTYAGMPPPTREDVMYTGAAAADLMKDAPLGSRLRADASLEEVQANLALVDYPASRLHFVEGRVEDTIPEAAPDEIALLRLDTDWYSPTRHTLEHLYPRLVAGGVLIIDDYGHWKGARKAVDDYFAETGAALLLNRVDYTCRLALKV